MTSYNKKNRKTATISLPKSTGKKRKTVKQAKTSAKSHQSSKKVVRKKRSSVAVAGIRTGVKSKAKTRYKKTKTAPKSTELTRYRVKPAEKMILVVLGVLMVSLICIYVATRIQTRTTRFAIAELKQQQVEQMRVKEKLTKKIAVYKRPELIMKRAAERGMIKAKSKQIEWVK